MLHSIGFVSFNVFLLNFASCLDKCVGQKCITKDNTVSPLISGIADGTYSTSVLLQWIQISDFVYQRVRVVNSRKQFSSCIHVRNN
ncbi:Uncharacterized protein APZ42_019506 [Daphnia magna]|uniref:Uncharacterized protein n=1 Tax=Daphnia magna TaxID=35525 RepID=A0A0P6CNI7_9CRUS|nr:Uncharacterized protein APZ42_019506 [Daphnia magna]